ncbi:MAG: NAD(P)H-dependent oxidoreductase [Desulfobacterales bacterium]|nr:NAD(P)H-dependent oxidoreductase [Desulfobacterales bacterium]
MLILGLQGSPRKKGNTNFLVSSFMDEAKNKGFRTVLLDVCKMKILPCIGCRMCEKYGFCSIDNDDMTKEIYTLLREASVIVVASPIFFYNVTSQLKALIDRSQTLWSRRYMLNLKDPKHSTRKGVLLSVGATKGKNLFEGTRLTTKYFFDAIASSFDGELSYRKVEKPGDIQQIPNIMEEIKAKADEILDPLTQKKTILFACKENACRSQIAYGFAQSLYGNVFNFDCAGSQPALNTNQDMIISMQEKGIDMEFRKPKSLNDSISENKPDIIVTMGCGEECPFIPGTKIINWDLPDPGKKPIEFMRETRDEIEKKIISLIEAENNGNNGKNE